MSGIATFWGGFIEVPLIVLGGIECHPFFEKPRKIAKNLFHKLLR
jgi:hypothetical protein